MRGYITSIIWALLCIVLVVCSTPISPSRELHSRRLENRDKSAVKARADDYEPATRLFEKCDPSSSVACTTHVSLESLSYYTSLMFCIIDKQRKEKRGPNEKLYSELYGDIQKLVSDCRNLYEKNESRGAPNRFMSDIGKLRINTNNLLGDWKENKQSHGVPPTALITKMYQRITSIKTALVQLQVSHLRIHYITILLIY